MTTSENALNWRSMKKIIKYSLIIIGVFTLGIIGIGVLGAIFLGNSITDTSSNTLSSSSIGEVAGVPDTLPKPESTDNVPVESKPESTDNVPVEYKSALAKAKTYQNSMNMSPSAIRNQLISSIEGFTEAEADYAIANLPK